MTDQEFKNVQMALQEYRDTHEKMSPSEYFVALSRLMERHHYGVTSRDLARGYEIVYEQDPSDGLIYEVRQPLLGGFAMAGNITDRPVALFRRIGKKEIGKGKTFVEWRRDREQLREINLAAEEHTTASDILGQGAPLLEHRGIDTGFGATPGLVQPEFMDMMLRKSSEKMVARNLVSVRPMESMTFYFPLKTSKPTDDTSAFSAARKPTAEGRAGVEFAISFDSWLVNGWKFLTHAGLSVEIIDLLQKWIDVRGEYLADLSFGQDMLWEYSILEGWWSMITAAKWRRFDQSGDAWADSEIVPLGGAAGANILGANAKKHFVWQNLYVGSTAYGTIYNPDATNPLNYQDSTARETSASTDDIYELFITMAQLMKDKYGRLEFLAIPSTLTEKWARDPRFVDMTQNTGNPAFQSERGYLGQISIGGSNQRVDLWEYDPANLSAKTSGDGTPVTIVPVFGGEYGGTWNLGIYNPYYVRVDDGFEVVDGIGTGPSNVLRPNETRVITTGSKGSSWPGDFNKLVIGMCVMSHDHT